MPDDLTHDGRMQGCVLADCPKYRECRHAGEHLRNPDCSNIVTGCPNTGCSPVGGPPAGIQTPEEFLATLLRLRGLNKDIVFAARLALKTANLKQKEFFS